ncbi:MAG TPA: hypothetical protein VHE61_04330 [Opitutaceae bacterium]|nr:hypothetical protein [Opitutaceae bacterium]
MSQIPSILRSTPVGELFTGTAFQAHPTDITAPLGTRFAGQTILAVHVAMERAATVRVTFDAVGEPQLGGIRNIRQRNGAEFSEVLRFEASAVNARWVVIIVASGWQAVIGQRAARADPTEPATPFARHRLMFDTPELVVPKAQVDRVYTAIDHPLLDKSIVFSLRRHDLEELLLSVRKTGLGVAGVKIAVASQLEYWLGTQGEAGLKRDLLLSDGLSALLLNLEHGDFVPPPGAVEPDQPRQAVQRPGAVEEDAARFIAANSGRSVTFIGPDELCLAVKKQASEAEIVRPAGTDAHDVQRVTLSPRVGHDLTFDAKEVRPAVSRSWRRVVWAYAATAAVLVVVAVANGVYAIRTGLRSYQLEREMAKFRDSALADSARTAKLGSDFVDSGEVRSWVAANYHAQEFCYQLLKEIPSNAALDKLLVEARDGQITLTFVVLGDQETQLGTHRAIERAINHLKYKIGGEEMPVGAPSPARGVQYRMHIIIPDAGDAAAT